MKLTKNEKELLKLLLDNGRIADVDMAAQLRISTQAVGKIRKKLEENGVIEGYSCQVNYEKLGLNVFALSLIKINNQYWKDFGEIKGRDIIKKTPWSITTIMPVGSDINLISLQAFRDVKEKDRYFHMINTRHSDHTEVKQMYPFSSLNFMKNSANDLLKLVLDNKPIVPQSRDYPLEKKNQNQ
jgi:DNA-binding Lrp family transcriptional regulator